MKQFFETMNDGVDRVVSLFSPEARKRRLGKQIDDVEGDTLTILHRHKVILSIIDEFRGRIAAIRNRPTLSKQDVKDARDEAQKYLPDQWLLER